MDIQDMRIFARVAAVQNLSAVGTELGLTPGTISKRIQALEDELSARLFDRTTRSIRITEEGAAFLAPRRAHPVRDRGRARQCRRQGQQAEGQAQDRGAGGSRPALRRPGAVRVRARLPRDRRARRPARPAGQPAGGRLRRGHPHRHAVGLLPDRQAARARPARDRRLARLSRPRRPPAAARGSRRARLPDARRARQWSFSKDGVESAVRVNGAAEVQQRRAALPRRRRRPRPDPRLRAGGTVRAELRQAGAGARRLRGRHQCGAVGALSERQARAAAHARAARFPRRLVPRCQQRRPACAAVGSFAVVADGAGAALRAKVQLRAG